MVEKERAKLNTVEPVYDPSKLTISIRCQSLEYSGESFNLNYSLEILVGSSNGRVELLLEKASALASTPATFLGRVFAKSKHVDHSFVRAQLYPHGGRPALYEILSSSRRNNGKCCLAAQRNS